MTVHLYDNYVGGFVDSGAIGSAYEIGVAFSAADAGQITGLRWFRQATGSSRTPTALHVWDSVSKTIIATAPSVPDDTLVGWQDVALTTPFQVIANREYRVSASFAAGTHFAQKVASNPTAPYPTSFAQSGRVYDAGGSFAYPLTVESGVQQGMDVTYAPTVAPAGPAATPADVDAKLADWLSVSDQTHGADSAPAATQVLASGSSGFAAIKTVVDGILTSVGSGLGAAVSTIGTTVGTINAALTTHMASWSASLATTVQSWNDGLVAWFNQMGGTAGGPTGALSGRSGFPTVLWTLVATADFTHVKSWDVAADLYTLSTASWPINRPVVDVDGAPWRPRNGWWAPRNGDLIGERRFIDWDNSYLEDQGRRMMGLVVWLEGETTGHLEAWQLT